MGGNNSKSKKTTSKKKSTKNLPNTTQSFATKHNSTIVNSSTHTETTHTYHRTESSSATDSGVVTRIQLSQTSNPPSTSPLFANATISGGTNLGRQFEFAMPEMRHFTISTTRPRIRGPLGSYGNQVDNNMQFTNQPQPSVATTRPRYYSETAVSSLSPQKAGVANEKPVIPIVINRKPSHGHILSSPSHIPMYNTTGKKRGLSLIINNIKFGDKPRNGADMDGKNLLNLLSALKLNPKHKNDLKSFEMMDALRSFAGQSELAKVDLCVIVIMSHGTGSMTTMTEIMGTDERGLKVYDIISLFTKENCKHLMGKPKIFIFQCCRGASHFETDAKPSNPPQCADMLLAYSTIPGFVAYRNPEIGSPYIREICKVFMEHACDTHVEDMLKKVTDHVRNSPAKQLSSYDNISFKNCYFNPIV